MKKEMSVNWHKKILELSKRETETEFNEFVELLDEIETCSLKTARTLLKTYDDKIDDYGSQEIVESILTIVSDEDILVAFLDELPRLKKEAEEWTLCIMARILRIPLNTLCKSLKDISKDRKVDLLEVLYLDENLKEDFKNIKELKEFLSNEIN